MVKVWLNPVQLPDTGVTVSVEVTGVEPVLVAVNEGIVALVPLPNNPMVVLLFVQL